MGPWQSHHVQEYREESISGNWRGGLAVVGVREEKDHSVLSTSLLPLHLSQP